MPTLRHLHHLFSATAAVALCAGLAACGGGSETLTPPAPAPGPASADGPSPDLAALAKICPVATPVVGGTIYTQCKASSDTAANLSVFGGIDTWLAANKTAAAPPRTSGHVTSSDGLQAVAVSDDCDFALEPGLGLWMASYKQATVFPAPGLAFNGLDSDEIDVNASGVITYMHTGDFTTAGGGMEVNFPAITGGSILEHIWGQSNQFVLCRMKD